MNINWKDILERALWTFAEGFLVALPTTFSLGMDGAAWKSALAAAVMAGLSATKTLMVEIVKKRKAVTQNSTEGIEE